ncbi:Hypothetical predicted protein [Pelobates cultripes]|uniref:Uncharacterized protein n=1 Tax=Pelobates cultripes TaxID=61616 RepID=A0AAD1SB82_PELCU|nr:Hypothetical predicted protein [Pelobates cultripes]
MADSVQPHGQTKNVPPSPAGTMKWKYWLAARKPTTYPKLRETPTSSCMSVDKERESRKFSPEASGTPCNLIAQALTDCGRPEASTSTVSSSRGGPESTGGSAILGSMPAPMRPSKKALNPRAAEADPQECPRLREKPAGSFLPGPQRHYMPNSKARCFFWTLCWTLRRCSSVTHT